MATRRGCISMILPLLAAVLAGCSEGADSSPGSSPGSSGSARSDSASASSLSEPTYLPAGDLPDPLRLTDVGGRTITAKPFVDFAVATEFGVWVSGVAPGVVRYDGPSGSVSARTRIPGEVVQALEVDRDEVLVPSVGPDVLFRLDARTGTVRARVRLPESPVPEATVGAAQGKAFVLINEADPRIAVIKGEELVDRISAPPGATAVRAGDGALWVPTYDGTVGRYSLASKKWTSFGVGPSPRFLDIGYGGVWVMNQGDGSVSRIDATTGEVETIPGTGKPIEGGDLTTGAGAVWLRTHSGVLRIDPRTREVTHRIDLPISSGGVAAVPGSLWITSYLGKAVHRVPLPLE